MDCGKQRERPLCAEALFLPQAQWRAAVLEDRMTAPKKTAPTGSVGNKTRRLPSQGLNVPSIDKSAFGKTGNRGLASPISPLRPLAQFGAAYTFKIPAPPSLNASYKNIGRGRAKTGKYKAWCDMADLELACQKPPRFNQRVDVSIYLPEPSRNSDIDNRIKPVMDSLVRVGVIENDDNRFVRSVRAAWSEDESEARVIIYYAPSVSTEIMKAESA
jgi:Holliday junction resolvase RusA-like endonuclease